MEQIKLFKQHTNDAKKFESEVNQWLLDNKGSIKG